MNYRLPLILLLSLLLFSCGSRAQKPITVYDFGPDGHRQVKLDRDLKEISGLTVTDQGHLLAHDDERGVVYRIDPLTGSILSSFRLGRTTVNEDFEGIAAVGDYIYLVTSDGRLYYFREGSEGGRVEYNVIATPLTRRNNVEGLCYDREANALLLACKDSPGRGFPGKRAIYMYSLSAQRFDQVPRYLIKEKSLHGQITGKEFKPSAIALHPLRFTLFVLASDGCSILELDGAGRILGLQRLDPKVHPQPEGIEFLPNGDMVISDEGKKKGALTVYFYREEEKE